MLEIAKREAMETTITYCVLPKIKYRMFSCDLRKHSLIIFCLDILGFYLYVMSELLSV